MKTIEKQITDFIETEEFDKARALAMKLDEKAREATLETINAAEVKIIVGEKTRAKEAKAKRLADKN